MSVAEPTVQPQVAAVNGKFNVQEVLKRCWGQSELLLAVLARDSATARKWKAEVIRYRDGWVDDVMKEAFVHRIVSTLKSKIYRFLLTLASTPPRVDCQNEVEPESKLASAELMRIARFSK